MLPTLITFIGLYCIQASGPGVGAPVAEQFTHPCSKGQDIG